VIILENKVYKVLEDLNIAFEKCEHEPAHTMEDLKTVGLEGAECKNLFLRNYKGNRHYLVVVVGDKKVDLKELTEKIGDTKLSFASEKRLDKYLGLKPGSVSPFGLINDESGAVDVILDDEIKNYDRANFHPCINTVTLTVNTEDLYKYIDYTNHEYSFIKM
jgi:Ala-tRNA(Pro) deacylase